MLGFNVSNSQRCYSCPICHIVFVLMYDRPLFPVINIVLDAVRFVLIFKP